MSAPSRTDAHLIIIDDVPLVCDTLAEAIARRVGHLASVQTAPTPLEVSLENSPTHAIVDLQLSPEHRPRTDGIRNGLEAISYLLTRAPDCRPIVITSSPSDLSSELARAIHQEWITVPFLAKQDRDLADQLATFVMTGNSVQSEEFRWLNEVRPLSFQDLTKEWQYREDRVPMAKMILTLADLTGPIDPQGFAALTGKSTRRIHGLLGKTKMWIRSSDPAFFDQDVPIQRLWLWAHTRRPLVQKHFADLVR